MKAKIRAVVRDDYDKWLVLWNGYNEFYGRSGPSALDPAITASTWERFFDPYEPMYALVAESGESLTGLAHFLLHRSTTAITPTCYLQDLFTAQAMRGQGIGRALIEAVYEWAARTGCGRVYWQTHETNVTAQRLYEAVAQRSGFIVYRKILGAT
jgi:GNAT superfamily N-acetyltransferase